MPSRAHYEPARPAYRQAGGRQAHKATASGGGDVADQLAPVFHSATGGFDDIIADFVS